MCYTKSIFEYLKEVTEMRIACTATLENRDALVKKIRALNIEPTITSTHVVAEYRGPDQEIAQELITIFEREPDHAIASSPD